MNKNEVILKLKGLRTSLESWLKEPLDRYFDPRDTQDLFSRFNEIRDRLQSLYPRLFKDLPGREIPTASGTTDYEGRGYIERDYFELLLKDINYCLEILTASKNGENVGTNSELKQIKNKTDYKKDKVDQQDLLAEFKKLISWWPQIKEEFGVSKHEFGRKINFVKGEFKRAVIFRDIEHAYALSKMGLSKPAVILAGSVMEELLRLYLKHKNIKVKNNTFSEYIRACKKNGFLKVAVRSLTTSVRHFRNLIHLEKESKKKDTISRATAAGAVTSIFTLVNDF